MSSGYGFNVPGQQPTPNPRAVGAQLMQGQQGQMPQGQAPMDDRQHFEAPPSDMAALARREGGKLMGGGGPDSDGALAAAVGEALTRKGGGFKGNPNPMKNREAHIRHLQQLGLSEVEANLLGETL